MQPSDKNPHIFFDEDIIFKLCSSFLYSLSCSIIFQHGHHRNTQSFFLSLSLSFGSVSLYICSNSLYILTFILIHFIDARAIPFPRQSTSRHFLCYFVCYNLLSSAPPLITSETKLNTALRLEIHFYVSI